MLYIYILKSLKTNKTYKGITNNIDRRLKEHFEGKCRSTKHLLPLKLVHAEISMTRSSARDVEKFFKCGYGREIIKEIEDELVV